MVSNGSLRCAMLLMPMKQDLNVHMHKIQLSDNWQWPNLICDNLGSKGDAYNHRPFCQQGFWNHI